MDKLSFMEQTYSASFTQGELAQMRDEMILHVDAVQTQRDDVDAVEYVIPITRPNVSRLRRNVARIRFVGFHGGETRSVVLLLRPDKAVIDCHCGDDDDDDERYDGSVITEEDE